LIRVPNDQPRARVPAQTLAAKRAFDLIVAATGLVLLSPLFVAIGAAVRLDSAGPVFFRQERVGRAGRPFRIFKFRSMVATSADANGRALTLRNDNRVTRVGAFLRRHKLDELPQLINVVKGEMSVVGPRPETPALMSLYTSSQRELLTSLSPGMTDYASIYFKDESAIVGDREDYMTVYRDTILPRKCVYWHTYSNKVGLYVDLQIVIATVTTIMLGRLPKVFNIDE
jgi:lipopolysaccharide/colanic/teichoic acid biosynthesis glycosyltransferase